MTSLSVKDVAGSTQTLGTSTVSSKQFPGHFNMAVPDGGASVYRNLDLGNTGISVKATAGTLYGIIAFNAALATPSGTQERFLKIYDKATAASNADTPIMTIPLESGVQAPIKLPACGVAFTNGLSVRATTGIADNNNGSPGTNDVTVNLIYA